MRAFFKKEQKNMQVYFAPLEGLTDSIYRQLHHKYFGGVDRYYTPFFSPTVHRALTNRESRELPAADCLDAFVVPQILCKVAEDFCWMAGQCRDRGYQEVNLNLGCPSGTVTAKGKGAGMLSDLNHLQRFLDGIFADPVLPISVKTRLGVQDPEEFEKLLEIYNRYPICQLTVHPRVRKDFYDSAVRMEAFTYAVANSRAPVCYNGNLCTHEDIQRFENAYPQVDAVMLGRGLIGDPGMLLPEGTKLDTLRDFHDELLSTYTEVFGGPRNAMFRMKESWRYWMRLFECGEKLQKRLRRATELSEYKTITAEIFATAPLRKELQADW